jgi:outer membrane lipoprotein-sorting protein
LSLAGAVPARAEDARQIVSMSLEPRETSYVGDQETTVAGGPVFSRRPQRQKVYRKGSVLRIDFDNGGRKGGDVVFDDGAVQIHYIPRLGIVERSPSSLNARRIRFVRGALQNARATFTQFPDETVAGRAAYVISIKDAKGDRPERKVWIDKENYVQLRQDMIQRNGRTVSTYFTRIVFGVEPPADKLSYAPPAEAVVVEKGPGRPLRPLAAAGLARRWGGLLEPKYVPPGYTFRGYYAHLFKDQPGIAVVYDASGPKRTLSVFQGPAMGMDSMSGQKRDNVRVMTARKGSADVAVVGPLPQEELQKVMDSVQ